MDKTEKEITIILQKVTFIGIVIVACFVPLFFLPQTTEYFEFNKQMLLAGASLFLLILWAVRQVIQKKLAFIRSSYDLPLLLLILSFIAATILAENQVSAIFGSMGRFGGTVISLFFFGAFFYLAAANLKNFFEAKIVVLGLGVVTAIGALLGLFYFFGGLLPLDFAKYQTFTPFGSPTALAVFAALVAPLLTALFLYESKLPFQIIEAITLFFSLLIIVFLNIPAAWLALVVGLAVVIIGENKTFLREAARPLLLGVIAPVALIAILNALPPVRDALPVLKVNYPSQAGLDLNSSWQVTATVLRNRPLFGSGPASFLSDFTRFRSINLNSTPLWNLRFLTAGNYYLELMATVGLIGFFAFLLIAVVVVRNLRRELFGDKKLVVGESVVHSPDPSLLSTDYKLQTTNLPARNARKALRLALSGAALGFLAALLVTGITIATFFLFFLILALSVALRAQKEGVGETVISLAFLHSSSVIPATPIVIPATSIVIPAGEPGSSILDSLRQLADRGNDRGTEASSVFVMASREEILPWFGLALTVLLAFFGFWQGYRVYAAELNYRNALVSLSENKNVEAYNQLVTAVSNQPQNDLYHRSYSQLNLALATAFAGAQDDPTAQQTALQLISQAVREANLATQINPYNVLNWENRAGVYRALTGAAENAEQFALESYQTAIQLDPVNPELQIGLGGLYFSQKKWNEAANAFAAAIQLKPDHANAHYNLAMTFAQAGDYANAKGQMDVVLKLIPNDEANPDYVAIKEQIAQLDELIANPPTANEQAAQNAPVPQAPVTKPTVTPTPTPTPTIAPEATLKSAGNKVTAGELIEASLQNVEESTNTALPR